MLCDHSLHEFAESFYWNEFQHLAGCLFFACWEVTMSVCHEYELPNFIDESHHMYVAIYKFYNFVMITTIIILILIIIIIIILIIIIIIILILILIIIIIIIMLAGSVIPVKILQFFFSRRVKCPSVDRARMIQWMITGQPKSQDLWFLFEVVMSSLHTCKYSRPPIAHLRRWRKMDR